MITYERLHKVLKYTPFDGLFRWKEVHPLSRCKIGDIAGTKLIDGYIAIGIDGEYYKAHRLAWFYVYGYWPEYMVDHIKRVRNDNRIRKLREANRQCNIRNSGVYKSNTSGVKGVTWNSKPKKWSATIKYNSKPIYLGLYKDFDEAVCARLAGEQCLDWETCDLQSSANKYVQKIINRGE